MFGKALLRAVLVALLLGPLGGALTALADDGRPLPGATGRPPSAPTTELRASDDLVPADAHATPMVQLTGVPLRPPAKELVIFVGGYGSRPNDHAFDDLATQFPSDAYDVVRFGADPRFPYDTYGPIDQSARALIDEIRTRGGAYAGVNLISHSMGGVVVDRAFGDGLSANDNVRTDIAIAGPHSGATFARVPTEVFGIIGPAKDIIRAAVVVPGGSDPDSAAARDLATATPVRAPVGVTRLDVTLATDGFVNEFDSRDPGVVQRVFLPASLVDVFVGHGGSLTNQEIARTVAATVMSHSVPPDHRDALTQLAANVLWDHTTRVYLLLLLGASCGALALAGLRATPGAGAIVDRIAGGCRAALHLFGR